MSEETKVISQEEYNKAVERAQRFEAQLVDLQKKLEPFEKIDLEKLKAHSEELDILKRKQAGKSPEELDAWKKEQRDAINKELRTEVQKELDGLRTEKETLSSRVTELEVVDKAMNELAPRFNEDVHPFIKDIVRQRVKKAEDGSLLVHNERGEPAYSPNDPNKPMSLGGLADELATKHPSFAKAEVVAGGRNNAGQQRNGNVKDGLHAYLHATPEERAARWTQAERGAFAIDAMKQVKL
jgi:exonuclease VII large subunit